MSCYTNNLFFTVYIHTHSHIAHTVLFLCAHCVCLTIQWNISNPDTLATEKVFFIARCPVYTTRVLHVYTPILIAMTGNSAVVLVPATLSPRFLRRLWIQING